MSELSESIKRRQVPNLYPIQHLATIGINTNAESIDPVKKNGFSRPFCDTVQNPGNVLEKLIFLLE
jgi:hypothetical protein